MAAALRPFGAGIELVRVGGKVREVASTYLRASGLDRHVRLGTCVEVAAGRDRLIGEVIAINAEAVTIKLFSQATRVGLGADVWVCDDIVVRPDESWLGRVINPLAQPIDALGPLLSGSRPYALDAEPLPPMELARVRAPCATGIRAVDLFTPICTGQRIGVFAGSGVGKSTLISMLARSSSFNTIVVALVAERGREVREFIEDVLAPARGRAVTVVATSAESAMMRKLSARTAMAVAEYFRDQGEDVLLVIDSITRYAHALREVALASGEPPVARGYAPSVFAELPRLLERAGPGRPSSGSITGVFSVLVDGDDHSEPIADTVRGILDGHIVLDRAIADQGRYPAVNPLTSISRLAGFAWTREEAALVRRLRSLVARFEETRELRALGAYKPGGDAELDQAVILVPVLYDLLNQQVDEAAAGNVFEALASAFGRMKAEGAARRQQQDEQAPHA